MKTFEELKQEFIQKYWGFPDLNSTPVKELTALLEAYHAQYEEKYEAKRQSLEMELCECGHIVPLGFIHYDANSCGTCINCINDELIFRLGKKNKQIKKLKEALKKKRV